MKRLLLLITLIVAVVAGVAVQRHVTREVDVFAVQTGSMAESAPIGSLVVTRPAAQVALDDIVTYDRGAGQLITHRVVERRGADVFLTKGDANEGADPWEVRSSQVRGVVQAVYPRWGYVLRFLTLPVGAASVASALVTVFLAWRLFFPSRHGPAAPPARA